MPEECPIATGTQSGMALRRRSLARPPLRITAVAAISWVPGAYGCPDDGSVKVWAAGTCPGRLPVKIHVSRLKYSWPGCPGHGLARHRTVRIG